MRNPISIRLVIPSCRTSENIVIKRIVIIDDEPAFGEVIGSVAEGCGYNVSVTTDPEAFKQAMAGPEPAMVVLDLSMPKTDGIELLRHLAAIGTGARILIISGFDRRVTETAANLGRELGLNMLAPLSKPVRIDELRSLLSVEPEQAGPE